MLAGLIWLGLAAFSVLMFRESQRSEYFADYVAAQAAGTTAAIGLMTKLHQEDTISYAEAVLSEQQLSNSGSPFITAVKREVASIPPEEAERLSQLLRQQIAHLDWTHPPTGSRVRFLEAHPVEGCYRLDEESNSAIDAELAIVERPVD